MPHSDIAVNNNNGYAMGGMYHSIKVENSHLFALTCTNNHVTSSIKMVARLMWKKKLEKSKRKYSRPQKVKLE